MLATCQLTLQVVAADHLLEHGDEAGLLVVPARCQMLHHLVDAKRVELLLAMGIVEAITEVGNELLKLVNLLVDQQAHGSVAQ